MESLPMSDVPQHLTVKDPEGRIVYFGPAPVPDALVTITPEMAVAGEMFTFESLPLSEIECHGSNYRDCKAGNIRVHMRHWESVDDVPGHFHFQGGFNIEPNGDLYIRANEMHAGYAAFGHGRWVYVIDETQGSCAFPYDSTKVSEFAPKPAVEIVS
jgi:hypothetical protein